MKKQDFSCLYSILFLLPSASSQFTFDNNQVNKLPLLFKKINHMYLLDATQPTSHIWETIATILFALSLISERISNLIKLSFESLRLRTFNNPLEKKRELRILILAIGSGIFTAVLAGADLFSLLDGKGLIRLYQIGSKELPPFWTWIGMVLSGIFISLGSKFWHDMLDIILQFSVLKKFQADDKMQAANIENKAAADLLQSNVLEKAKIILPQLIKIQGYAGYFLDNSFPGYPKIVFDFSNNGPDKNTREWLESYFAPTPVTINTKTKISLA